MKEQWKKENIMHSLDIRSFSSRIAWQLRRTSSSFDIAPYLDYCLMGKEIKESVVKESHTSLKTIQLITK